MYRKENVYVNDKSNEEVFVIASRGCPDSIWKDIEIQRAIKEGKKIVII